MERGPSDYWTMERVATLKTAWATGDSCSVIGAQMGITRNAVIGKATRLHLEPRQERKRVGAAANADRGTTQRIRKIHHGNRIETKLMEEPKLPAELPAADIPLAQRKGLFALTNATCRWPYGDPGTTDFFFCGAPDADCDKGKPYCAAHGKLARGASTRPITKSSASYFSAQSYPKPKSLATLFLGGAVAVENS